MNIIARNEVQAKQYKGIPKHFIGIAFARGNTKLRNTEDAVFYQFNLLAEKTCPYKTELCSKSCYAKKSECYYSNVKPRREVHTWASTQDWFVDAMIEQIEYELKRKCNQNKKVYFRFHESGDLYNVNYLTKLIAITNHFKGNDAIMFQCYTKSMPILEEYMILNDLSNLDDVNINFVWSIWDDTNKEYTEKAIELGLQTFTALPQEYIESKRNEYFICQGDCGACKVCYEGKHKQIVIAIH